MVSVASSPCSRDCYTIPIYDKMSRVIGFTARTMSDNKDICKYLNLKNSLVYHKDTLVFGINFAQKAGTSA